MNTHCMMGQGHLRRAGALLLGAALLAAGAAWARLSEPCNIYYGQARGIDGRVLSSETNAAIYARINGVECARQEITRDLAANVNYALRITLDDGWDARCAATAARAGEQPQFFIAHNGVEYAVQDSVPVIGAAGVLYQVDVQAAPEPAVLGLAALLCGWLLRTR